MPSIIINVQDVYGSRKAYPICLGAKRFASIAGTKTLTAHTLREVLALGYDIAVHRDGVPAGTIYGNNGESRPAPGVALFSLNLGA